MCPCKFQKQPHHLACLCAGVPFIVAYRKMNQGAARIMRNLLFAPLALPCGKYALQMQATPMEIAAMMTAQTAGARVFFMWLLPSAFCFTVSVIRIHMRCCGI